jgi:hypothetical protein
MQPLGLANAGGNYGAEAQDIIFMHCSLYIRTKQAFVYLQMINVLEVPPKRVEETQRAIFLAF